MKKSIVLAALGLAAAAVTSYGQGFVTMNSYSANGGNGFLTTLFDGTTPVGAGFSVELYYALGTVSDPVNEDSAQSVLSPVTGLTAIPGSIQPYDSNGDGYFGGDPAGVTVTIANYTTGPISFELVATGPGFQGRSGAWTESLISTAQNSLFGDNGVAPNFVVAPVPEPATLALAGLGGLASLVALRRKQA